MAERVALIIGNSAYAHAPGLANPRNDAIALGQVLQALGFEVDSHVDLTNKAMEDALYSFGARCETAEVALFFYAGHGIQFRGENYLIPIDAELQIERQLGRRAFSLTELLESMRAARHSLLFIDACRDSPFSRSFAAGGGEATRDMGMGGLAELRPDAAQSSFIAFATAPNTVAFDGAGVHSPFTQALLQHIVEPDVSIADMMIEVRNSVRRLTNDRQIPWDQSSLQERFFFSHAKAARRAAPKAAQSPKAAAIPFNKRQRDAFIHYVRSDAERVEPIAKWLRAEAELSVLLAPDGRVGRSQAEANAAPGLADARAAIFCVTGAWAKSRGFDADVRAALALEQADRRYRVIALVMDDSDVPDVLSSATVVDLRRLDAESAVALLQALVPLKSAWAEGNRDVYLSRSWRGEEMAAGDLVCAGLMSRHGFRLIGDAPDYAAFDADSRVKRIIESCGALVAVLPYREDPDNGFTSKFIVKEIQIARELGRPYLLFAASGVSASDELLSQAFGRRLFPIPRSADDPEFLNPLNDFDEQYQPSDHPAFSYIASSLLRDADALDRSISILEQVTSMPCLVGQRLQGQHVQQDIVRRIQEAEFIVADVSEGNLNTLIEAGIARGAGARLHLISRPTETGELRTRFMLRDLEVNWYRDPLEQVGVVYRLARRYRRQVIEPGLS